MKQSRKNLQADAGFNPGQETCLFLKAVSLLSIQLLVLRQIMCIGAGTAALVLDIGDLAIRLILYFDHVLVLDQWSCRAGRMEMRKPFSAAPRAAAVPFLLLDSEQSLQKKRTSKRRMQCMRTKIDR